MSLIQVIAVDDEPHALRRVGKLLESIEGIQVAKLFDKSHDMLDYALTATDPIDLVLLDMEMPGLHGLQLAHRLRELRPDIQIGFLTAYEEYARDAFDVEALDYLLKPVTKDDLERTIGRYLKRIGTNRSDGATTEDGISIRALGPFAIETAQGENVKFRNSKSAELLAYLYHHGGKSVSKAQIMDDIWYGRDVERTQVNLHSTVYQLRKDLEPSGLSDRVEQSKTAGGSYRLSGEIARDDVRLFEQQYQLYKQSGSMTHVLRAVQLYGDGYLAGSGYGWAAPRQAELELQFEELLEAMIDVYIEQNRYDIALFPMKKLAQMQPLDAIVQARVVALLLLTNRRAEAAACHKLAMETLGDAVEGELEFDFTRLADDPLSVFKR